MNTTPPNNVAPVSVLHTEVLDVLRYTGPGRLHPGSKILLASMLFADNEGIAKLNENSLRRWCAEPGSTRASSGFLRRQIDFLTEAGVLAPGSTPTELRSMLAYRGERTIATVEDLEQLEAGTEGEAA